MTREMTSRGGDTNKETYKSTITERLKDLLELDGSPVAIAVSPERPSNLKRWARRGTVCVMVQKARRGGEFYCSADNIICGGRIHVGIDDSAGRNLNDFLIRTEKLAASNIAARRLLGLTQSRSLDKVGEYLVFAPLESSSFTPDVVVFIGTPLQVSRIIWLDAYQTGRVTTLHGEPMCSGVIAGPISRHRIGISFMDMACRSLGRYRPEELAIGVPYERMIPIIDSIDKSVAGSAKPKFVMRLLPKLVKP